MNFFHAIPFLFFIACTAQNKDESHLKSEPNSPQQYFSAVKNCKKRGLDPNYNRCESSSVEIPIPKLTLTDDPILMTIPSHVRMQYSFVCSIMPPHAVLQISEPKNQLKNTFQLGSTTVPQAQSIGFIQLNNDSTAVLTIGDSNDNFSTVDPNCAFELESIVAYPDLELLSSYSKMVARDSVAVDSASTKIQTSSTWIFLNDSVADAISLFGKLLSDTNDELDLLDPSSAIDAKKRISLESRKFNLSTSQANLQDVQKKLQNNCKPEDFQSLSCQSVVAEILANITNMRDANSVRIENVKNFLKSEVTRINLANSDLAASISKILASIEEKK